MVSLWRAASNNVLSISGTFILFVVKPQQLCFTTLCTHDISAPLFYPSSGENTPFPIPENMTLGCFCIIALSVTQTIHYIFWQYNPPAQTFSLNAVHTLWTDFSLCSVEVWKPAEALTCIITFKVDNGHRSKRCFIYTFCRHTAALAFIWSVCLRLAAKLKSWSLGLFGYSNIAKRDATATKCFWVAKPSRKMKL